MKSIIDFIISLILLIIFSPILIVTCILLFILNNGRIFFIQNRPGKKNKIFKIIKFKTMNDKCDSNGRLLPDHMRTTILGNIIRKLSIDELPQLLNVLKGEMSIIGPRPLLIEYLKLYNDFQMKRHDVKPGITGLAQIKGRNSLNWQQKFKYDVFYVENLSFCLDIMILFSTIKKVIKREGINQNNSVTAEAFNGKN